MIFLKEITADFLKKSESSALDEGVPFLHCASLLLLYKSRNLLPHPPVEELIETEETTEALYAHLQEYSRFKQAALELVVRQDVELAHFGRPFSPAPKNIALGLEEVALSELVALLGVLLQKSSKNQAILTDDEKLTLADLIESIRAKLAKEKKISFYSLFSFEKSKDVLILSFLALLELMKRQEVRVLRQEENIYIAIL